MVRLSCVIGRSKFMGSCCEGLQQNGAAKQRGTQQKRRRKNEETRKQAEVNVNQIRYFVSVAQEGSLSQAARLHGVTAQAISKSINELERDVKEPLFFREHSGVGAAGAFYFKNAYALMASIPALGEMLPFSTTVPLAEKDRIPIPLCLILPKGRSSQAARKLERLLKSRPASQRYNRASRTKPAPPLAHLS